MTVARSAFGLLLAFVLFLSVECLGLQHTEEQAEAARRVTQTYEVMRQLERISLGLAQAEAAVRGYILLPDPRLVDVPRAALQGARDGLANALRLTEDDDLQQERLRNLAPLLVQKTVSTQELALAASRGSSMLTVESLDGSQVIARKVAELVATERQLLGERTLLSKEQNTRMRFIAVLGMSLGTALFGIAFVLVDRQQRRRLAVERQLELRLQLSEHLQACKTLEEAYEVLGQLLPRLFGPSAGVLCITHTSRNIVEQRASWGALTMPTVFLPDDCWALRRGRPYVLRQNDDGIACKHLVDRDRSRASVCHPLVAHGDLLGLLHVSSLSTSQEVARQAEIISDQLAMGIANLQLQEKLQYQSIRDPLTGLSNRRYLEETFDRELCRAARSHDAIGLVILDVDHFKRFNDSFGHEAGDLVLQEIGKVLRTRTRGGDVVARLGGEELALVLPGSDLESSRMKAEEIRAAIEALEMSHLGRRLGAITVSAGVAVFPTHGVKSDDLLRIADVALYEAKRAGRNRVIAAPIE